MGHKVQLVEISASDLPVIREIYAHYALHTLSTFHTAVPGIDELREFIPVEHPLYKAYLVLEEEEVAGYCYFSSYRNRPAYRRTSEVSVYLKPEFTGHGLGLMALQHLEQEALKAGISVFIATISGANEGSLTFFERNGYSQCGQLKQVGEKAGKILDVFLYQKILDEGGGRL